MTNYNYPASENAKGTHLSENLVKSNDKLEAQVFQKVHDIVGDTDGVLVDIGAGEGRYSAYFGAKAAHITVIEPDAARLNRAKNNLSAGSAVVYGVEGSVIDVNIDAQSADVVLNVHVLQHVHPKAATDILDKAAQWLKPGGKLVLCFTQKTAADSSEYNISWKEDEITGYSAIPKSLFELIANQPPAGVLSVHQLDKDVVKQQLKERHLEVMYEQDYTPRLLELKRSRLGRLIVALYAKMNPMVIDKLQQRMGYKKFVDVCIVAQKM